MLAEITSTFDEQGFPRFVGFSKQPINPQRRGEMKQATRNSRVKTPLSCPTFLRLACHIITMSFGTKCA